MIFYISLLLGKSLWLNFSFNLLMIKVLKNNAKRCKNWTGNQDCVAQTSIKFNWTVHEINLHFSIIWPLNLFEVCATQSRAIVKIQFYVTCKCDIYSLTCKFTNGSNGHLALVCITGYTIHTFYYGHFIFFINYHLI